jgi:hypothetical protein
MALPELLSRLRLAPLRHHLRRSFSAAAPPPDQHPPAPPQPPSNPKLFVAGATLLSGPRLLLPQSFIGFNLSLSRLLAGLSWSADERSLTDAFSSFGTVTEGKLPTHILQPFFI